MRDSRSDAGFTLLEVIVAFAILSIALGLMSQGFATGYRNQATAQERLADIELARSLIAEIGVTKPLEAGRQTGELRDGRVWSVDISAFAIQGQASGPQPYWIRVTVAAREPRHDVPDLRMTLETIKLKSVAGK